MQTLFTVLTFTHIGAGVLSLIAAPIAMVAPKGGRVHRLSGKIFLACMTWICFSALVLSINRWNPFLLLLAIFSFYSVYAGYRTLHHKQMYRGAGVPWYDWMVALVTAVAMLVFLYYGIYLLTNQLNGYLGYLSVGFGIGGSLLVWSEVKIYWKQNPTKNHWLFNHIGKMTGGFIASLTAFSTQTMEFLPGIWQWIWPSMIGVPCIFIWIRYYRNQIANNIPLAKLIRHN